ncbi:KAP family P-loop NTPase fold protein [Azospirillum argentinense]|uniref:AAA+ ATPase domain-containing protein n=1 Tax=Azospirillum brasilense TaxID=192 RepID=A0A4D8QCP0_AZOBR|nr:P-loop NTPase fold protein [Azospirillum argentinense]QCO04869.1 hypothetical protein D3867_23720 [Azospirillum argentinense]
MRFTPKPLDIADFDGFAKNDLFGLQPFGENFANLVQRIDEPLVIALDGPWGSGKSTFARQWAGLLRQRKLPVIVFDAFANDHQPDAFLALAAEITALARQHLPEDRKTVLASFVDKAKKAGKVLLPTLAKVAVRGASLGVVSASDLDSLAEVAGDVGKGAAGDAASLAEKLIEKRLNAVEADRAALDAFRDDLSSLATALRRASADADADALGPAGEAPAAGPLVFIIDELDRCRPSFALSLLEQIKHLFSVDGVCFVLVTHMPQIETVVRGQYGAEMDARTYLEKFFHLRLQLPNKAEHGRSIQQRYLKHLWTSMALSTDDHVYDNHARELISVLSTVHPVSLRTLERIASVVVLLYAATNKRHLRVPSLMIGLVFMSVHAPAAYSKARAGRLTWAEASEYFNFPSWPNGGKSAERFAQWWRYATDPALTDEAVIEACSRSLFDYSVGGGPELLPLMAAILDDLAPAVP